MPDVVDVIKAQHRVVDSLLTEAEQEGADVKAIQGLLRHRGYGVQVDAVFGVPTRDAVATFDVGRGERAERL